jgi:hypothetical protein
MVTGRKTVQEPVPIVLRPRPNTDISGHNSRKAWYTAARAEGWEVSRNDSRLLQEKMVGQDASDKSSKGWRQIGVVLMLKSA